MAKSNTKVGHRLGLLLSVGHSRVDLYNLPYFFYKVSEKGKSVTNYKNYQYESLIVKTLNRSLPSTFILCEKCYWCATYLDKTRIPLDNKCLECDSTDQLSSLVIMCNESFIFNYNDLCGVDLKFTRR
jgi:hypothetical protein